ARDRKDKTLPLINADETDRNRQDRRHRDIARHRRNRNGKTLPLINTDDTDRNRRTRTRSPASQKRASWGHLMIQPVCLFLCSGGGDAGAKAGLVAGGGVLVNHAVLDGLVNHGDSAPEGGFGLLGVAGLK